jgi:AraC-like DNA-binding protein
MSRKVGDESPCSLQLGAVSSRYREYVSPAALRPFLVCAWTLEIAAGDRQHRQRVLPDSCTDIVWVGESPPFVVGPMTQSALAVSPAGTTLVGLRLRPAVAARVFGVAAHELADRHVPLDQVWPRDAVADASNRVIEQRDTVGRVRVAQSLLARFRHSFRGADPLVQHAVSLLYPGRDQRIERLARTVGVSERQLRRRFVDSVGYSPKLFQRILRFQRLLTLAKQDESARLDQLALLAGYADQPHMTRDVGEFAGVTPCVLVGNVDSALKRWDPHTKGTA